MLPHILVNAHLFINYHSRDVFGGAYALISLPISSFSFTLVSFLARFVFIEHRSCLYFHVIVV